MLVSTLVVHSGTGQQLRESISPLATSFLEVVQGSLVAFRHGLLPVNFSVPLVLHHLANFGAESLSEEENEVVSSLCLSCSGHA